MKSSVFCRRIRRELYRQSLLSASLLVAAWLMSSTAFAWISDNGNGTYSNPLFYEEFSDPDMIRVGEDYYFTGTTMHAMPGLPVLHSRDLVNWTLISYAFNRLDLGPEFRLEDGGEIYGQGIWAPCIRFHQGTFYIFSNVNRHGTQVYRAQDPAGPWEHTRLGTRLYDLSVLFDDDGRIYAVHGVNEIHLSEINSEVTDVVPDTERIIIPRGSGMGEGLHFYKINGKYFIITAIPGAHTPMRCARSDSLDGPWDIVTISSQESMGIGLSYRLRENRDREPPFEILPANVNFRGGLTLHQGGIVDTPEGQWWGFSMMDHNSVGRLTCLSPVVWTNGWPYFGLPGNLERTPRVWVKPETGHRSQPRALFERTDDFSGPKLKPVWQWNHAPDDTQWSLSDRAGYLRLHSLPAPEFWWAKNTLTQRAIGPESTATAELDASGMKPGDVAGLALLNRPYAWVGVACTTNGLEVRQFDQLTGKTQARPVETDRLWFRAHCNFDTDLGRLSYSGDGRDFIELGGEIPMPYQLKTFQGIRYSLFHFNTAGAPGGVADFAQFTVDEPRSRGLTKPIPCGQLITLSSKGSGAVLAVKDGVLEVVAGRANAAIFKVVDRDLGRVALKARGGGYVSIGGSGGAGEVTIKGGPPGDAETFQWVDMQRGDLMLMSLATHRFLTAGEADLGPAAANAQGTRPDRLDGVCFEWKIVSN